MMKLIRLITFVCHISVLNFRAAGNTRTCKATFTDLRYLMQNISNFSLAYLFSVQKVSYIGER